MKKTKVYRPRRGMRFSDDVAPSQAKGGFVGNGPPGQGPGQNGVSNSSALTRPHVTLPKPNIPRARVETFDTSMSLMAFNKPQSGVIGLRAGYTPVYLQATMDATSHIYIPQNWTEWQSVLTASNLTTANYAPTNLWLMQDSTTTLADAIGSSPLTAELAPASYQTVTPGWTTRGITQVSGTNGQFQSVTNPITSTGSFLCLAYYALVQPSVGNFSIIANYDNFAAVGNAANAVGVVNTAGSNITNIGSQNMGSTVHPIVLNYNASALSLTVYNDLERVPSTYLSYPQNAAFLLGGYNGGPLVNVNCASGTFLYSAAWSSNTLTPNYAFSDAQVRTLLKTLGWSVGW